MPRSDNFQIDHHADAVVISCVHWQQQHLLKQPHCAGNKQQTQAHFHSSCFTSGLQETRRAGEHLITTDALQLLHWELHGAVLKVLQQLISTAVPTRASVGLLSPGNTNSNISEKGVLQLLFDQKLLRAVVGAGQPLDGAAAAAGGSAAGAAAAEIAARQRLVTSVEQQLQVMPGVFANCHVVALPNV